MAKSDRSVLSLSLEKAETTIKRHVQAAGQAGRPSTRDLGGGRTFGLPPDAKRARRRPVLAAILGRLVLAAAYGSLLVLVLGSRTERLEGAWTGRLLGAFGEHRAVPQASVVLVHPTHGLNMLLRIGWSCSSVPVLAAVGAAGLLVGGAGWWRRLAGLGAASLLVVATNVARLATSMEAAVRGGQGTMLLWHDWAGTGLTLLMGAAAIWVCVRVSSSSPLRPATARA